ncbi:hypothetical protein DSO57_1017563 [Entomophthora muscae]|uniref:Uncharacterized protein n=1 Tax=Entomophthora muscae TaxID=34485 RepID=A0ACC2STB6_9FUNG|nr:hypothetical protein DSO57_1017563 [Entomophthora muscae]
MKLDTVIRQLKARNIRAEKLLKYYEEILNIRYKIRYNGKSVGNLNFFQVFDRIIMFCPSFAEEHLYELVLETGRMAYYNSPTTKFKSISIVTRHPYYYPEDKGYVTKEMSDSEFSLHSFDSSSYQKKFDIALRPLDSEANLSPVKKKKRTMDS